MSTNISLSIDKSLQQYALVTFNYWMFTLSDGALRMLTLLYFHQLGYNPFELASIFILYEIFGIVTNLFGGWVATRIGLNSTMNIGLLLQIISLLLLTASSHNLSIPLVMVAQALSGVAKDLNKLSAKSSVKKLTLISHKNTLKLYWLVAILTGSKNTIKGLGFFLGGFLLASLGFKHSLLILAGALFIVFIISLRLLVDQKELLSSKIKLSHVFSKSTQINLLSSARLFLFGARDIWFVIALPVYLYDFLGWSFSQVGAFFAFWIIGYGVIQAIAPKITNYFKKELSDEKASSLWIRLLSSIPFIIAFLMLTMPAYQNYILVIGLCIFGIVFAINSSIHSFLIVNLSKHDSVSMDVGFYYMANAAGRLIGTILSGLIYQAYGFKSCLIASGVFLLISYLLSEQLSTLRVNKNIKTKD